MTKYQILLIGFLTISQSSPSKLLAHQPEQNDENLAATTVSVVTTDGKPVSNAMTEVFKWTGEWESIDAKAISDSKGTTTIRSLPTGEYLTVVVRAEGYASAMQDLELSENEERDVVVKLSRPATCWLSVRDENDQPVEGATIQRLSFTDENKSEVFLTSKLLPTLTGKPGGFALSDKNGRLGLPDFPINSQLNAWVIHPKSQVAKLQKLNIADGMIGTASMKSGVQVRINLAGEQFDAEQLNGTMADVLMFPTIGNSSSQQTIMHRFEVSNSRIEFTASPVEYNTLRVTIDNYLTTPTLLNYSGRRNANLDLSDHETANIALKLHKKVKAKGRIVDADGQSVSEVYVSGMIENRQVNGQLFSQDPQQRWASGGSSTSNSDGIYEIELIAGRSAVEIIHEGYFADPSLIVFDVAADGSTTIPTITLNKVPQLQGQVIDADGKTVSDAIVRMRSIGYGDADPTGTTDGSGQFELNMTRIPYAPQIDQGLQTDVFVVAFNPSNKQAGRKAVDLKDANQTANITVQLESKDPSWVVDPLVDLQTVAKHTEEDVADHEKLRRKLKQQFSPGLPGNPVPDLSAGTWLNSEANSLQEFRGQYVLLDFWFIGCGPCHRDMPSVRMAHQAFRDSGFSVVSVHTNSQTAANVKQFADSNNMDYPIVVDNADGELLAAFRKLGINGFPGYILLDRDGNVLINDRFSKLGGPSLRQHKNELIHQAIQSESRNYE